MEVVGESAIRVPASDGAVKSNSGSQGPTGYRSELALVHSFSSLHLEELLQLGDG